jgi:putative ABC transport system permease protein
VWQLLQWDLTRHSRAAHFMEAVARLAPGQSTAQAQSAVDALARRLAQDFPATNGGWGTRMIPLLDEQLGYYRPALLVLAGAVGLLLLIGCLNVASLLLTRALSRDREIAVRLAMGASPRQLLAQLLAESFVLCAAGAAVGVALTAILLPIVVRLTPVAIPRLAEAHVNLRALGLGIGILAATTILFALVPALLLVNRRISTGLRTGERGSSRGARRTYSVLVASEVALACALLVSSALLVRTVGRMTSTPLGVDADDVLTASVQLPAGSFPTWDSVAETHAAIVEGLRAQPGVREAGAANFLPLEVGWRVRIQIEGEPAPLRPEDAAQAQYHSVSDGYFETVGATIVEGRSFAPSDTATAQPVVVVNQTFVHRYLAGGRATGRGFLTTATGVGPLGANLSRRRQLAPPSADGSHRPPTPATRFEIVGVVADVRNAPLGQSTEPAVYFSTRQFPFRELFLAVRASDRGTAAAAVRNAIKGAAPTVPTGRVETWGDRFAARTAEARLLMTLLLVFGGLAAFLAALGVYGLFSWSVALRTRELAIRLTLGAPPARVGQLVLRQSLLLVVAGLGAGLLLVRAGERALSAVLFEVSPADVSATAIAACVLLGATVVACVPPVVRAMRVDPAAGLRAE